MANHRTRIAGRTDAAAVRVASYVEESRWGWNSRLTLYFTEVGDRLSPSGRKATANAAAWQPTSFAIAVEYPFAPGLPSCMDMLRDLVGGLCPVIYDEARWEDDPRILEQAGASVIEDWALDARLG